MLYLIGLGIIDEKDISFRTVEIAKKCECYCEFYTSKWLGSIKNLEQLINKKIEILNRRDLEENQKKFLEKAKSKDIALFVSGDPLIATTHIDLVIEAKKMKIPYKIIHSSSIFSAVAESGLQIYKFGKSATITFSKQLENVKDTVQQNKKLGLHTILLLDIDYENEKYMTSKEAIEILLNSKIISEEEKIIALSIKESSEIFYKRADILAKKEVSPPSVIIIPGKLHFRERDFLDLL